MQIAGYVNSLKSCCHNAVAFGSAAALAVDEPTLNATVIDGSRAYTPTQLFAAYRDQLGRPINTSNAQAIITQLEALYLRDGYSRPEFRLDEDLAASGILRIEVFEAQITRVVFSGDAGPYDSPPRRAGERAESARPVANRRPADGAASHARVCRA